ncbi:MAG: hypothetical protein HOD85_05655 [Deltaproteobacteria bacterium]|jgi:hypothetical protein|nr:hypothetical protein [Deltaproteobacteria bacterium]MBT4644441.1 hypothetical protein [Deltaproteobacteria bacterium]
MVETQDDSLGRIPFNEMECKQLVNSAFWMKFIAILMVVVAVLNLVSGSFVQMLPLLGASPFLWLASRKLNLIVETDGSDQEHLSDTFLNLRNYLIFKAIITIVAGAAFIRFFIMVPSV